MDLEEFKKIQEYKALGLSNNKIAEILHEREWNIRKIAKLSESEFLEFQNKKGDALEKYIPFIMDIIKTTPTIKDSNVFFKLRETFPEFQVSEASFYRFVKKLRKDTGYARFKTKGTSVREEPIPGEEAQVDFGQYKIKDMYGVYRRVYFFVMVLRYSQLKYVYFSSIPFNSLIAINAHKYAFEFFDGIPKVILYDQDRVFCVHENYGNIILTEDFEEYVKRLELSVVFCSGYNPQAKGLVENCVKIVKENFLEGRVYKGIDSLNSACLEWLDNYANTHEIARKGKTSHELFREEVKALRKIPYYIANEKGQEIYHVNRNAVQYRYGIYEMPLGFEGKEVKLKNDGINVIISDIETGEPIVVHPLATAMWQRRTIEKEDPVGTAELIVKNIYDKSEYVGKFLENLKTYMPRYYLKSCVKIKSLANFYTAEEMETAFKHCIENNKCTVNELSAYLIYRYGKEKAEEPFRHIHSSVRNSYYARGRELKEERDG